MKKREIRRPFVRQFYRKNKLNFVLAFAATVVMAFANLVISWLLQQIMDLMAGSGNTLSLGGICWVLLGIVATIISTPCPGSLPGLWASIRTTPTASC